MAVLGVGKEILSYCNRCQLSLAHIILTMKETKVDKVQCKTCQSKHIHRGEKKPSATRKKSASSTGTRSRRKTKMSSEDMWQDVMNKTDAEDLINYSPKQAYKLGDVINHPSFGPGLIDKLIDENKIQVIFRGDVKTLIHNR